MLKRWLKLLGKILLALVVLLVVSLLFERFRGQISLASYKRELAAKGEKLTPQDFARSFKTEDNGAPAVIAAIEKLQKGRVLSANPPFLMQPLASGRAKINFQEPYWITKVGRIDGEWSDAPFTNHWEQLAQDLAVNSAALVEARLALNQPVLNNDLDYSLGPKVKLTHLAKVKSLMTWLSGEAQLALRAGDRASARKSLLSLLRLQALLENDHFMISELVRCAIGAIARANTWEGLQADGWTDAELSQLQNAWAAQSYATGMVQALERALMTQTITHQQLRASNDEAYQLLATLDLIEMAFEPIRDALDKEGAGNDESGFWDKIPFSEEVSEFFQRQVYCRIWRFAWSHQAELKDLKVIHTALEFSRRANAAAAYIPIKAEMTDWLEDWKRSGIYDRFRYLPIELRGSYGKFVWKTIRVEIDRSQAVTAIALKRYQLRHGQYPDKLELLVPEFCSTIPTDWVDGKPIKYRLNADGSFTLYSVGEDGQDDGGDLTLPEGSKTKDLWRRRDYVWPAPATPEEVEEYRQNAGRN